MPNAHTRDRNTALCLGTLLLLAGCAVATEDAGPTRFEGSRRTEREESSGPRIGAANTGARLRDPESVASILKRSAALVEGTVRDIRYEYDETEGPRTIVGLEVEKVHHGKLAEPVIHLRMFGGPTPRRRFMRTTLSVDFREGERYLLFLRNDQWFYSPLAADALKIENRSGREVLTHDGRALTSVTPDGFGYGYAAPREGRSESDAVQPSDADDFESRAARLALGALRISDFVRLVQEAIRAEGISLGGEYASLPEQRTSPWNVVDVSRSARRGAASSGAAATPATDAGIPADPVGGDTVR